MQGSRGESEDWPTSKELPQSAQYSSEPGPALISSDPRKGSVVALSDAIGLEGTAGTVSLSRAGLDFWCKPKNSAEQGEVSNLVEVQAAKDG